MKIFIPRNISGWRFSMSIQVWPFSVSVFQLITLAIGLWLWLWAFNTLVKSGVGKVWAILVALPLLIIFVIIAFFKYSELTLIPFIAKMIKTHFLDVTKKHQINRTKPDPIAILLAKFRKTEHDQVIERKKLVIDEEKMKKLNRVVS